MWVRSLFVQRLVMMGLGTGALGSCGSVSSTPDAAGAVDARPPVDASIDSPGQPCTTTTCANDMLEVCGTDGFVTSIETCALGCSTDGMRCAKVDPSNGLATQLDQAAQLDDIVIPDDSVIDTSSGMVSSGAISVSSATVTQSDGSMLRVLMAKSFTLGNVHVIGSMPLALVAWGDLKIQGVVDASATGTTAGAGAIACATGAGFGGAPGTAYFVNVSAGNSGGYPQYLYTVSGSGGGGFGTAGGAGGQESGNVSTVGAGGVTNGNALLVPLRGGCDGYAGTSSYRGRGGGALQLVSNSRVQLTSTGALHVGGSGGHAGDLGKASTTDTTTLYGSGGGGSGGGILIEAPSVIVDAASKLLAGGGGGGGYGACSPIANGADAPPSANTAPGGACPSGTTPASIGGDGATTGASGTGGTISGGSGGGGGGGLGRVRVNTADGQFTPGSTLVRGSTSAGTVGKR